MSMVGMSIEEVRGLASQLQNAASEIQGLQSQLTGALSSTTWVGNDRTQFESDWHSQHARNLQLVVQALQDASSAANRNAADQEQVSNG